MLGLLCCFFKAADNAQFRHPFRTHSYYLFPDAGRVLPHLFQGALRRASQGRLLVLCHTVLRTRCSGPGLTLVSVAAEHPLHVGSGFERLWTHHVGHHCTNVTYHKFISKERYS